MEERLRAINPEVQITSCCEFVLPETAGTLLERHAPCDAVVDCIDSVAPKVALIRATVERSCLIVSAMGAGGRVDASQVQVRLPRRHPPTHGCTCASPRAPTCNVHV